MGKVMYPFGPADKSSVANSATTAVSVSNSKTIIDLGVMAQDTTVNATIEANIPIGSELHIKAKSDGTARALTPGTGFTGVAVAGVINKTKMISFVYDGSTFIFTGAAQID